MNIICNNCVGGRIYQQLNKQYNNPFIWNIIFYNSYKNLITLIDKINFTNFSIKLKKEIIRDKYACVLIDNLVEVHYIHYIQNSKHKILTKQNNGVDIYFNDILSYTNDKYISRLNRMNINENIFILVDDEKVNLSDNDILDFLNLNLNGIKFLITNKDKYKDYNENTNILITSETNTNYIAKELINRYPDVFNN